jgi:hypothetical protein
MKDINGVEIKVGMKVKTQQQSGGILSPAPPQIGIVEDCVDAFNNPSLQIRFRTHYDFDQFILLEGKINEVVVE